jgi:5-methylcytosine-specific restriction endonuclease McrA
MVRPCLGGCGRMISRNSYCATCDPRPARVQAKRGSRWQQQQFRTAVLRAAGGRCERCGSTDRVETHHLVPVANGGQHDPALNGAALCWKCHRY